MLSHTWGKLAIGYFDSMTSATSTGDEGIFGTSDTEIKDLFSKEFYLFFKDVKLVLIKKVPLATRADDVFAYSKVDRVAIVHIF